MKCPNCNYKGVSKEAHFCPNCGKPLPGGAGISGSQIRVDQRVGKVESQGSVTGVSIDRLAGDLIVVSSLSELDSVDQATRGRLRRAYEAQVERSPEQARYHLALGLYYLDMDMYAEAVASLSTAHQRAPQDANVLYYLALAHIGGKRPRRLAWSDVQTIEAYLKTSVRMDPRQAHVLYLWVLIKYDYYVGNGLRQTPPSIDELLTNAERAEYKPAEIEHLFRHVPVPQSLLTEGTEEW